MLSHLINHLIYFIDLLMHLIIVKIHLIDSSNNFRAFLVKHSYCCNYLTSYCATNWSNSNPKLCKFNLDCP